MILSTRPIGGRETEGRVRIVVAAIVDFIDFVDIAIDNGLTKIHLRVVAPALPATVVQVCHHKTIKCTSMHPIY